MRAADRTQGAYIWGNKAKTVSSSYLQRSLRNRDISSRNTKRYSSIFHKHSFRNRESRAPTSVSQIKANNTMKVLFFYFKKVFKNSAIVLQIWNFLLSLVIDRFHSSKSYFVHRGQRRRINQLSNVKISRKIKDLG